MSEQTRPNLHAGVLAPLIEGPCILLIEDNPDHQLLERKALEGLGAGTQVVAVATAVEGLEALGRQDFDLVMADYHMPGMTGLEFLRTLKERHIAVPVVIVTGLGNERVAVAALKQGACDYVIKETGYLDLLPSIAERTIATCRIHSQLDEARRRTEVLQEIAQAASSTLELTALLRMLVKKIVEELKVERTTIYLPDEQLETIADLVTCGVSPDRLPLLASLKGRRIAAFPIGRHLLEATEPIVIPDATQSDLIPPDLVEALGMRATLCVPVRSKEKLIAALFLDTSRERAFTPDEVALAKAIADQAAVAIENAQLYQRTVEALKREEALVAELKRLQHVAAQIASNLHLNEVLNEIVRVVAEACGADMNSILIVDEPAGELIHGAAIGLPEEYVRAIARVPIGGPRGGCCGTAAARGQVVIVEDMRTHPLWQPYLELSERMGLRAVWSVPIVGREGRVLATFATYYREPYQPSPEQIELVRAYARHAAVAIENARLYERLAASEMKYRNIFENAIIGIYQTTPEGQILAANPTLAQLLGYESVRELLKVSAFDLHLDPANRRRWREGLEHRGVLQSEGQLRRRDGKLIWVRDLAQVVRDGTGRVLYYEGTLTDITEQKRAEEALRDSEARYRLLFESNPHPMWVYDLATLSFLAVNDAAVHHYGYSRDEFLAMTIKDIRPSEDIPALLDNVAKTTSGLDVAGTWRHRKKDGTIINVEITSHTLTFAGRRAGLVLANDITERQRAEAERQVMFEIIQGVNVTANLDELLQLIHQSLEKVLDAENCFVALYDRTTETFNFPFFVDQFDTVPPPQSVGKSCTAYVFRTGRPLLMTEELFRQLVEQGEVELVGTPSPCWLGVPLKTPSETIGVLVIQHYEDEHAYTECDLEFLTSVGAQIALAIERKRAETALREAEARYRDLYENANDIIYTHDLHGRFTSVNRTGLQTFGYTVEEVLQTDITSVVDSKYLPLAQQMIHEKLTTRSPSGPYELLCRTKDGRPIWLELNTRLIEAAGRPVGVQGIARNITERKQAEEENRRLQQQLLQAQKMESIGTLAGGIAHDFNNLLQGILGYASLALLDVEQQSALYRYLRTILESAERAASLITQMLTFSRRKEPQVKPIDVNGLVEESLRMLRHMIPTTIEIHTRPDPNLWTVEVDATQIQQVLVNLCVNARDAMPGGGTLTLETENRFISEAEAERRVDAAAGRYILITISDTGVGMTAAVRERVFEPFFTTKGVGEGTGLGLAVAYGIVRSHKGWINVYSEPGQGAVFKIYLPAVEKEAATQEPDVEPVSGGSETILVVDDEPVVLQLGCDILRAYGYHTLAACNGEEAIRVYRERSEDIDLVLLDLTMPKLNGLECAKRLKALNPTVRLIASSGYSAQGGELFDGGIQAFVPKPYGPEELARVVRTVLDERDHSRSEKKSGRLETKVLY